MGSDIEEYFGRQVNGGLMVQEGVRFTVAGIVDWDEPVGCSVSVT